MKKVSLYKFDEKRFEVSLYHGEEEVAETLKEFDNYADSKEYAKELSFKYNAEICEN